MKENNEDKQEITTDAEEKESLEIMNEQGIGRTLPYEKGELHNPHGENFPLGFHPEE